MYSSDRLAAFITAASGVVAGICLVMILSATALQVFFRYLLDAPLAWPAEFSRLVFVWLAYGGCLVLPRLGQHLAITFVHDRISSGLRWYLDLLIDVLGAAFFVSFTLGGISLVQSMAGLRLPALQLPTNLMFGFVTFVAALQAYLYVSSVVCHLLEVRGRFAKPS